MNRELRATAATAALLGGATAALYGAAALRAWFQIPAEHISIDAARTFASTGATAMPLFIHVNDALWLQPIPVYAMALALKLSGGASAAPRLITAAVAIIDVALTYLVARLVFRRDRPAVLAAALLLLTPAHLLYGSTASPPLYSVPFVLLWLLAFLPNFEDPRRLRLFAATAALGLGVYTDPEAVWTMTAFAALTLILLARSDGRRGAAIGYAAAGFSVMLLPLVPWYFAHPGSYIDTMGRWAAHPAYIRNPIDGLAVFFRYDVFARRVSLYWDFFSPRHFFFSAQAPLLEWTGGVLLWPLLLFLPVGLYSLATCQPRTPRTAAIIWGFFIAPLAAAAFDESRSIAGSITLLPFAAVLGAVGIETLLEVPWIHQARSVTASERRQTQEFHSSRR